MFIQLFLLGVLAGGSAAWLVLLLLPPVSEEKKEDAEKQDFVAAAVNQETEEDLSDEQEEDSDEHEVTFEELAHALEEDSKELKDSKEDAVVCEEEDESSIADAKAIREQTTKNRDLYVAAKRAGKSAEPLFAFVLSREDILDHIEDMNIDTKKFPVLANVKTRSKQHLPDSLRCGEWCMGLMYAKKGYVLKFSFRMDGNYAKKLASTYTSVSKSLFPKGEHWYDVIIDSSFCTKREVYDIVDNSYRFILEKYYRLQNNSYVTNAKDAQDDLLQLTEDAADNVGVHDETINQALRDIEQARKEYLTRHSASFNLTRERIMAYTIQTYGDEVQVFANSKWYRPARLKVNKKAYALIWEKDEKVSLTVRISDDYANWLSLRHPEVRRAGFPKNRNWYTVPVDGSFPNTAMVYRVLRRAKFFVENKE